TRFFKRVGQGDLVEQQACAVLHRFEWARLPVEAVDVPHRVNPRAGTVLPAQEGCPCGLTVGTAGVAAGELHSLGGKAVDVRRFVILAAVYPEVGVTKIVRQNEDDVRLPLLGERERGRDAKEN